MGVASPPDAYYCSENEPPSWEDLMMARKFFSALFLLTALSVGLGSLGHAMQWGAHFHAAVGGVDPGTVMVLALVWYWVSGTMLVFGILLVWCWWKLRRDDAGLMVIPWVTGGFYILAGIWAALWIGPFFWLFPVLGVLLWLSAWMLRPRSG